MKTIFYISTALAVLIGLYLASLYNYLLFHSIAEFFSIVITCGIFMVAWNTRRHINNNYLLFIGIAYLFVGILDFTHTISFKGMNVLIGFDANAPTQLWIAARYMEGLTLLAAPLMLHRKIKAENYFFGYAAVTIFLLLAILYWRIFPDSFIDAPGGGLTPFKIISEYVICLILLAAAAMVVRYRAHFDRKVLRLLLISIGFTIFAELAFTRYGSVYGFSNLLGHYFKIVSFYFIYMAIIATGLSQPFSLLFRDLDQQRQWLKVTLESIGDAVIATDKDGRVTFLNKVGEALTGWSTDEAAGQPVQKVFHIVNQDTRKVVEDPVTKVLQSGLIEGLVNHTVLIRKDGAEVPIDDSAAPIRDAKGRIIGVVLIFRDISERERAEKALRENELKYKVLFENMNEAMTINELIYDEKGDPSDWRILDANPEFLHGTRKTRADLIGRRISEAFGLNGPPALSLANYAQVVSTGKHARFEGFFEPLGMHLILSAFHLGDSRFATLATNITHRKRAEHALRQLNETLEKQVAERTDLAETRARQLRMLAVELIEAEEHERQRVAQILHDDLQQLLAAARFQIQAACPTPSLEPVLENVMQLLDESITKSRRLSHELSPAVLHHSGLVDSLNWLIRQMNEQFGLHVELKADKINLPENSPLKVFLFRALQELLFNIVKHAGVNHARIELTQTEAHITMVVSDEGQGFDPGVLDALHVTSPGFGLLSLRERACHIGGSLEILSAPEQGSRFILSIPLTVALTVERQRLTPETTHKTPIIDTEEVHAVLNAGIRVLLVDDHQMLRHGLIKLLSGQADIQVVGEAANGLEAIELVRQLRPDVVVMDISMPEMDGIEATRRIKAEWPDVRVIGLSMFEDEQIANAMTQAGAEAFVSKTASSTELLKAIYKITCSPEPPA